MTGERGHDLVGLGRVWSIALRGGAAWFAQGASGYLLGPCPSMQEAEAALAEDLRSVEAGLFERDEALGPHASRNEAFSPSDFPDRGHCIEDFDGDLEWCVRWVRLRDGRSLYLAGTPDGPLPDLHHDRRRCRLAVIAAKARDDSGASAGPP